MASMKIQGMLPFRTVLAGIMMISMAAAQYPSGITQEYCSNQNTASDFSAVFDRYQSMGSCSETCRAEYAFAVVQGNDCWCSNYIPAQQSDVYDCDASCPGYPGDWCGNSGSGMYGYIALDKQPSGTAGASSQQPQSTTASQPQSSSPPPPPTSSSEPNTTPQSSSAPPPPPASSPTTSSITSNPSPAPATSQTDSPSPIIHTQVITRSGSVVTQTVTTTPVVIAGGDSSAEQQMKAKAGLSSGVVAGIVIGSLLGLAALLLAAFLLYRRRKRSDAEAVAGATRPKRTTSVLSRTGLLSRGRPQSMAENPFDNPDPYAAGAASVRHSVLFGAGATIEPSSPLGGSQDNLGAGSRRHSRPLVYDQRLNPSALFANAEANGSRVSMQDQQDYSRPLGVANPDVRPSFDSRISR